jgi:hypothetical protein
VADPQSKLTMRRAFHQFPLGILTFVYLLHLVLNYFVKKLFLILQILLITIAFLGPKIWISPISTDFFVNSLYLQNSDDIKNDNAEDA